MGLKEIHLLQELTFNFYFFRRSRECQIHPNFLENTHKPAHPPIKHTSKTRNLWWIHSPQHRLLLPVLCQRWSVPFPGMCHSGHSVLKAAGNSAAAIWDSQYQADNLWILSSS